MIRNPFARTRRPRPTDPDPFTRLDHLDGLPGRTRYDAEWPDVLAAEAPGGDLAAMAAPLPGMARDDLGTYAEPVVVHIEADVTEFRAQMARLARAVGVDMGAWSAPVLADPPRGRHRQTDPLDLILADLRDLDGLS